MSEPTLEESRKAFNGLFAGSVMFSVFMGMIFTGLSVASILSDFSWKFAIASGVVSAASGFLAAIALAFSFALGMKIQHNRRTDGLE